MDSQKDVNWLEDDKGSNSEGDTDGAMKRPNKATKNPASSEDKQEGEASPPKMSKNQQKKRRRLERAMEVKKRRKHQDKEAKRAKAVAQGRDIDQEKEVLRKRTATGESLRKRDEKWERDKVPLLKKSFQVCLDCAYEPSMTSKEIGSLALQLRYCYSSNRHSPHPCLLTATNISGATAQHLENESGYETWKTRAFTCTSQPLEEYYQADLKNVVYLTNDSEHTLTDLDDKKIYVIGGIVDRNRLKWAAFERASSLGVATARLPLEEHLKMQVTRVLTCNHVFDILLKYREHGRDWKKALNSVLPLRKGAEAIEDGANVEEIKEVSGEFEKDDTNQYSQPETEAEDTCRSKVS
jgi:tRNA (guanine9-N1)-methyltransferase